MAMYVWKVLVDNGNGADIEVGVTRNNDYWLRQGDDCIFLTNDETIENIIKALNMLGQELKEE